jgi:hypothetical protein
MGPAPSRFALGILSMGPAPSRFALGILSPMHRKFQRSLLCRSCSVEVGVGSFGFLDFRRTSGGIGQ